MAVDLEKRYRGLRAPHKIKMARLGLRAGMRRGAQQGRRRHRHRDRAGTSMSAATAA